ncbi:hypothetical protein WAI453_008822 [Rhynchosporium graminicola]
MERTSSKQLYTPNLAVNAIAARKTNDRCEGFNYLPSNDNDKHAKVDLWRITFDRIIDYAANQSCREGTFTMSQHHSPAVHSQASQYDNRPTTQHQKKSPVQDITPPTPRDVFIAVMGVTGSRITTFIQQFCQKNLGIGYDLESFTHKVDLVPCIMPNGQRIFLIETPGFDDIYRSATDILGNIADWLA